MTPARRTIHCFVVLTLAVAAVHAKAQQPFDDPANLAGERVKVQIAGPDIPENSGAVALTEALRKLRTRASLLMIVAHPDDEDGGMLTYEVRGLGTRAAMLTLTRGEGGQNLMTGDFYDALGLVRTQELLAADRYFGTDQMFGTEADFGFSKTKEEALAKWGHDRVLYDAVRAVRLYRPLVLTSVFIGGPTDGHGHHQVAGEITQEVFTAAGDPGVFPDQIAAGLQPWTPLKVYARLPFSPVNEKGMYDYATGKYVPARFYNYVSKSWSTELPKASVLIPEGTVDTQLGMTYVQFARKGLALQKTQIGEGVRTAPPGRYDAPYHLYGSRVKGAETEQSFFDGIDTSLPGIAMLAPSPIQDALRKELARIDALVEKAQADPSAAAPFLRDGLKSLDLLISRTEAARLGATETYDVLHELRIKRAQFNQALIDSLGLTIEGIPTGALAMQAAMVPGQNVPITVTVTESSGQPLNLLAVGVETKIADERQVVPSEKLVPGGGSRTDLGYFLARKGAPLTRPPFSRPDIEQAFYDVKDPSLRNAALPLAPFVATAKIDFGGAMIELKREVGGGGPFGGPAGSVPGGRNHGPLAIVPAISVAVTPSAGVVPLTERSFPVTVQVSSAQTKPAVGEVKLQLPEGWTSTPATAPYSFSGIGSSADFTFSVTPGQVSEKPYTMTAVATLDGREYREGFGRVGYSGLTPAYEFRAATYRAAGVDVKIAPGLKVAYLPGTGDAVAASLKNIGIHASPISVADVAAGKLDSFDVVILGVRAYAAHPELAAANAQLLDYAARGGVVIVQYNTGRFPTGPWSEDIGGAEKVVDEDAPVRLLDPKAKVLSTPNRITANDFSGWVEERGHGFMQTWDPRYEAPTETHDPAQDEQKGGLLIARTGKGYYVYLAYALYRQLPEGVPGAYRLFANLLSLGK